MVEPKDPGNDAVDEEAAQPDINITSPNVTVTETPAATPDPVDPEPAHEPKET